MTESLKDAGKVQDTFNPAYWKMRIEWSEEMKQLHRSIYECSLSKWEAIQDREKRILLSYVREDTSIFDAGCSYGHVLDNMPAFWHGRYLGVDLSPDLLEIARSRYPAREFILSDLRNLPDDVLARPRFDLCLVNSVRGLIVRTSGINEWLRVENSLLSMADCILFLEFGDVPGG